MPNVACFLCNVVRLVAIFLLLRFRDVVQSAAVAGTIHNAVLTSNTEGESLSQIVDIGSPLGGVISPCRVEYRSCSVTCGSGTETKVEVCEIGLRIRTTYLGKRECTRRPCPTEPSLRVRAFSPVTPKRQARLCNNPGSLKNGRITSHRPRSKLPTTPLLKDIEYECNRGYSMVGLGYIRCMKTPHGPRWSRKKPKCFRNGEALERAWRDWSDCSSSCGPGVQHRQTMACTYNIQTRRCRKQSRVCNLKPCSDSFSTQRATLSTPWTDCLAGEKFSFHLLQGEQQCTLPWLANVTLGNREHKVCARFHLCCRKFNERQGLSGRVTNRQKGVSVCPIGTFSKTGYNDAATGCRKCPVGTYTPCRGQVRCSQCPAGFTTSQTGSSSLQHCEKIRLGENNQIQDI